jgi:hypothetical protein
MAARVNHGDAGVAPGHRLAFERKGLAFRARARSITPLAGLAHGGLTMPNKTRTHRPTPARTLVLGVLVAAVSLCALTAPAARASGTPLWHIWSIAEPTAFRSTDGPANDEYIVSLENVGTVPSSGEIIVTDMLPAGIVTSATPKGTDWTCTSGAGQPVVTCNTSTVARPATDSYHEDALFHPGEILIPVSVPAGAPSTATNAVTVSGGGAPGSATTSTTNQVNATGSPAFGLAYSSTALVSPDGSFYTQAGGHPYALTTDVGFNQELVPGADNAAGNGGLTQYADAVQGDESRTVVAELPLGLIGNPQATPQCPAPELGGGDNFSACPANTQVGAVYLERPGTIGPYTLFNLVPEPGHAAEFGLTLLTYQIVLYGSVVHTGAGYVLRVTAPTPRGNVRGLSLTFFGDPSDVFGTGGKETAFLTSSFDCSASEANRTMVFHADSWDHPGLGDPFDPNFSDPDWTESDDVLPSSENCGAPVFHPSFDLVPRATGEGGSTQADEPSGYEADLKVPQTELAGELATPELKDATITLPEGLGVSPSAAGGVAACSNEQIDLSSTEPGSCPLGSQIGTVKIVTPLLASPLEGQVFLGEPECSPCSDADATSGRLFRLFIQAHSDRYGVTIKLPGTVTADPTTGRLTVSFRENPQLPFSELQIEFKSGPRAPLANPQNCGTFTTASDLSPWSSPVAQDALGDSSFNIDWDGKGGSCPASLPYNPAFNAGTLAPTAGAYSPLVMSFTRGDREQDLSSLTVHTPPGLLGRVAGVEQCVEAAANAGTCGLGSLIGTATVAAGAGEDPFTLSGKVFLTGPYKGAPFGLSVAVPAIAGPFNLGVVVVRAAIQVDPNTAALTITSDPLPQYVDGVQLRLRTIAVAIDRVGFTFNPTNCASQQITATVGGSQGATANVSSSYAANGCASLPFALSFTASTQAKTSKAGGASLTVKVLPGVGQANIARVDLQLPKQLPARLSTLQQACTETQFNTNPAGCPAASDIGVATARTPVLNSPLTGPAYLVSHGGAAFPDVEFILQGEGVTIVLDGKTQIKKGITYSHFETVPDAPISSFETILPEGPHSVLGTDIPGSAKNNLCGQSLKMPTTITAQNGKQIIQSTKIAVTGCTMTKAKSLTRGQKLARALKECKKKPKGKRAACERQARKKYGPIKKVKKTNRRGKR